MTPLSPQSTTSREPPHDASASLQPPAQGLRRAALGIGVLGAFAFVAVMVATLPAKLVARSVVGDGAGRVTGTVWSGSALLPNDTRLMWRADPLGSIASFGLRATIELESRDTTLTGRVLTRGDAITFSDISGRAGWSLVRALTPGLDLTCDIGLRIASAEVVFHNGRSTVSGSALSDAGKCTRANSARPFDVPATSIVSESRDGATHAKAVLASNPAILLIEAEQNVVGDITLTAHPAALKLAPGANVSGSVVYELRARPPITCPPDC